VIAHESGVANTVDPMGGSYFSRLTNETEDEACYFHKIEDIGVAVIENGYLSAIAEARTVIRSRSTGGACYRRCERIRLTTPSSSDSGDGPDGERR
jgi:methylmalonyl-CoA mutase N-terminal domain/subunit